jgi:hypothetical protein
LDLEKIKAIYVPNDDYFVSVGLQWTYRKIGKIVTLYQREMFKTIPCLGIFCTQSVKEGLIQPSTPYSTFYSRFL